MCTQYRKIQLSVYSPNTRSVQDFYYDTISKTFEPVTKNSHINRLTNKMVKTLPVLAKIFCLRNKLELIDLNVISSTFTRYNNIQIQPIRKLV
jgi:hypothetical protein